MATSMDPDQEVVNNADVERNWAEQAFKHAETYLRLIKAVPDHSILKLTKYVERSQWRKSDIDAK